MRKPFRWLSFVFLVLFSSSLYADPYGAPFQVDADSAFNTSFITSTGRNGDTMLLWQKDSSGGYYSYMQRYDVAGQMLQSQKWYVGTRVNRGVVGSDGRFALLSTESDGSGTGVYVAVYNRNGSVLVSKRRVNSSISGNQVAGGVAMNDNGQFAVVWLSSATSGSQQSLYVKTYAANGAVAVGDMNVFTKTGSTEYFGATNVGLDGSGNFVVAWDFGDFVTLTWTEVYAQHFNAVGSAITSIQQVNVTTNGGQDSSRIAINENGDHVITWTMKTPEDTNYNAVYGQRFNAAGVRQGTETRFSNPEDGSVIEGHSMAMAPDGSFVLAWHSNSPPGGGILPQILARGFHNNGQVASDVFTVSQATNAFANRPGVGMDRDGHLFIGWAEDQYSSSPQRYVKGRRYSPIGTDFQSISNGVPVTGLSGAAGSWQYFKVNVPAGDSTLDVAIYGGTGDADVYVRYGALPDLDSWDARPYLNGNNETARIYSIPPGDWYIGVRGYISYQGLSLQATSY